MTLKPDNIFLTAPGPITGSFEQRRLLKQLNDKYRPQIEFANQTHRASAQTLRLLEDAYQRERAYINNLFTGE